MRKILVIAAVILAFALRFRQYEKIHVSHIPESWFGSKVSVTGIVTDDPDRGLDATKVAFGDVGIVVSLPDSVPVLYGDRVQVYGRVDRPEPFMTDTGRQFDYPKYLEVRDAYATMRAADARILDRGHGSRILAGLFAAKRRFVRTIRELFPKAEAGLFAGIIIGEKSLLPKDVLADFQTAGLTHMIVLSGYNITIVALAAATFLSWCGLGYRGRRIGAVAAIPVFLMVTGTGASSVRAGIMAALAFMLQVATRPPHTLRIILYAAGAMVFANPRILFHDPSFHMSFLAFVGLVYVTPVLEAASVRFGEWYGLRDLVVQTLSVQAFVMPYILWMGGRFSLLLLVSNILTVPAVPLVMGAGFAATLFGMLSFGIGSLLAFPVGLGLSYIIWVARSVAAFPSLVVTVPPFSAGWMVAAYAALVAVIGLFRFRKN